MKTFSIIIPYYNSNEYIEKSIYSIINNNYNTDNIEIVVVDDGSKNDIYENINKITKEFKNVKFYKKDNGQWGSVINYVLKNRLVSNDYVSILDSDDFYDVNCFNIINSLPNSDILCGSFKTFDGSKNKKKFYPSLFSSKKTINSKNKMKTPFCLPLPFFIKNEIFYKTEELIEGIAYQDGSLLSQYINNSSSFSFSKKVVGYYYFNRIGNTSTAEWDENRFDATYRTCIEYLKYDNQEFIFYRLLFNKEFRKKLRLKNIKFNINRKFNFSYWPFFIRAIIKLYYSIKVKNYFLLSK